MREPRSFIKLVALAVLAVVLGFCLADVAMAAMPAQTGAPADCMTLLCEQGTCKTTSVAVHGLPSGTLVASPRVVAPVSVLTLEPAPELGLARPGLLYRALRARLRSSDLLPLN